MRAPAGRKRTAYPAGQAGFSLIAAVFLIVVLAGLAAFAVQVAMSQAQAANLELLQAQAQSAAQTGIEYGANIALQTPAPGTCRANTTLPRNQPGLSGFVVTLTCVRTSHQIGAGPTTATYYAYALSSSASHGSYGSADYVARKVSRNVTDAPP